MDFLEAILNEAEGIHYGFEPLMQEFVWFKSGDPELLKGREPKLREYYNKIYKDSKGNAKMAYLKTREWARGIFK